MMIIDPYRGSAVDPTWADTLILFHLDESAGTPDWNRSGGWRDEVSEETRTLAASSASCLTVSSPAKYGNALKIAATDCLQVDSGWPGVSFSDFAFGTDDFCLDFQVYFDGTIAQQVTYVDFRANGPTQGPYPTLYITANRSLRYYVDSADRITSSDGVILAQTWQQIRLSRHGTNGGTQAGTTRLWVDDALIGSWSDSTNYSCNTTTTGFQIGRGTNSEFPCPFDSYIDELRIKKGTGFDTAANQTAPWPNG
jgi:hypothetical protein